MKRLLVLAAGVLATGAPSAGAATIDVTVADDLLANDGRCSLREAVRSANLDAAQFPGAGECAAGDLADTIQVPAGTFTLSITGPPDEDAQAGDLDLLGPVTIVGAGAGATTIDANHNDRVLDVKSGVVTNLQGLTITGGKAPGSAPGAADNQGSNGMGANATGGHPGIGERGGGIRSAGALTIADSAIVGNEAGSGGAGGNAIAGFGATAAPGQSGGTANGGDGGSGADGGGIWSLGSLTLVRVRVQGNKAGSGGKGGDATGGQGGGGIADSGGGGGNAFAGDGGNGGTSGGIHQIGGALLTIQDSVISGNTAGAGGAGGTAQGGLGGAGYSFAGSGGLAYGGNGGPGGEAGGLVVGTAANISRTLLEGNAAGDGGNSGNATAGDGGPLFSVTGTAGRGGDATAGNGGAGGNGGALWSAGTTATSVTIANNASGAGGSGGTGKGGNGGNTVNANGTTGSGGNGTGGDGGVAGEGGAILAYGPVTAVNATITGNVLSSSKSGGVGTGGAAGTGAGSGGAAGTATNGASAVSALGSAVARKLDPVTVTNTILAGNTTPACEGTITGDHNISFADASCPGANVNPLLGPLADNGGRSFTRRPGDGSPAIDGAPTQGCPATDQRGATRPHAAGCDIGAYEIAPPDVAVTAGAATARGTVNPNARDTIYHFEYGTGTTYGSATPDANLPGSVEPVAVSATLAGLAPNTTYHLRLVASNADGASASSDTTFTTGAQVPGGDTTAPVILSASVKPKKFRRKRGTTFRYRLSEDARLTFTIQRKKGKRYVKAKRFTKASKAGANTRKFRTRKLKPGRYRATLLATDAANNRSKPKRLTFRILR